MTTATEVMTEQRAISVLLVDDHTVVRSGFRRLLEHGGKAKVVGEAGDGEEAYRLYTRLAPEVVVMDISLPGMTGLEATRRICTRDPEARVLMLSVHDNPLFAQRAIEAGALGYITKASDSAVLEEALATVFRRRRFLGPDIAQGYIEHSAAGEDGPLERLSEREFAIFQLVVAGLPTPRIAEKLHVSSKTVSNNLTSIKQKLKAETTVDLVRLAMRYGIVKPEA